MMNQVAAIVAKRRRVAAAAAVAIIAEADKPPKRCQKYKDPQPFRWATHVERFTEAEFRKRYRLDHTSFVALLNKLRGHFEHKEGTMQAEGAKHAKNGVVIEAETQLAIALRFFAGGDYSDLAIIYHVSGRYVFDCVWRVVDAINAVFKAEFPIDNLEKLTILEAEFRAASRDGIWKGQVACLDGIHVSTISPSNEDVMDPRRYHVARKDKYALLCMALCDSARRFLWWDMSHSPTTHDSLAFMATPLGVRLANGDLPSDFFINGDAAFTLSNWMITPSGRPDHDDFDFFQSSNRMHIECAFGVLLHRWGVLWRPLRVAFHRRAPLLSALMHLHNYCIDRKLEVDGEVPILNGVGEVQPNRWQRAPVFDREGRPVKHLAKVLRGEKQKPDKTERRDALVHAIEKAGLKRPPQRTGMLRKTRGQRGKKRN